MFLYLLFSESKINIYSIRPRVHQTECYYHMLFCIVFWAVCSFNFISDALSAKFGGSSSAIELPPYTQYWFWNVNLDNIGRPYKWELNFWVLSEIMVFQQATSFWPIGDLWCDEFHAQKSMRLSVMIDFVIFIIQIHYWWS